MMGHDFEPVITRMQLEKKIARKNIEKDSWLPVRFVKNGKITNLNYSSSGHIKALCETDGLLFIPAGVAEINEGSFVNIRLI